MDRVCMIVLSKYPNDVRVRREAETLEREGIDVDIICLRDEEQARFEQFGRIRAYRVLRQKPKESIRRYLQLSLLFSLISFFLLQKLFFSRKYRVIQVHNMPDFLIFIPILQRLFATPLVLDLHDLSVELFDTKWGQDGKRMAKWAVRLVERWSCRFANRLITTSQGFRERLIARGNPAEKITLVLNTPDERVFAFQNARTFEPLTSGARLLYHGTVADRFGLIHAIRAMTRLRAKIPGSTFNIYGRYDDGCRRQLESAIQEEGLEGAVFLNGWRSHEEIRTIIEQSDIGLVPYNSNEFMNLALSTKTFEYAMVGLPMVASRLPSICSIFDDRSLFFANPGDPEDLADKIAQLCLDPRRRRRQVREAEKCIAGISGSIMAERYLKLMQGLIQGANHH